MDSATPFDASTTADVILRSNHTIDSKDETRNGLPIVSVTEDSRTLRFVLLLIYPPSVINREPMLYIDDLGPVA